MMSDSLIDEIPPEEIQRHIDKFIIASYHFLIEDRIETVIASVSYRCSSEQETEIHAKTNIEDCFALNMVWPNINLSSYEFKLGEDILKFEGPFQVISIGLKDIDHERKNSILIMKIKKIEHI